MDTGGIALNIAKAAPSTKRFSAPKRLGDVGNVEFAHLHFDRTPTELIVARQDAHAS